LNTKQLARYRALLEEKRAELLEGFESARSRTSDSDEEDKDYIDYAVSSYTKEFLFSLSDMERQQLVRVEDALKSIDAGTYGACDECGEEIEVKRLQAVPWAVFCLRCQELADRGLLRPHSSSEEE
jgi:DnaK suppressor protein